MKFYLGRQTQSQLVDELKGENPKMTLRLDGWKVGGPKAVLEATTEFNLHLTAKVSITEIHISLGVTVFGFGLDLSIEADRDYGAMGLYVYAQCPLGIGNLDVSYPFQGREPWNNEDNDEGQDDDGC